MFVLARSVLRMRTIMATHATVAPRESSFRTVSGYQLEKLLGSGGMGWVYRARHLVTDRIVALKILREEQLQRERAIDRMMREAAILATLSHAGMPRFFECGLVDDGRPWIAMELVKGTSLTSQLGGRPMHHRLVIGLVRDVAGVLAGAHDTGVMHRDLKPDNILLTPDDYRYPLRLIDWGIAHQCTGARYTNHDETIGTPTYMAPEQARGTTLDGSCDVYGLGVVAYQALTGRPPFRGATAVEILVQHLNRPVPALAPWCPDAPLDLVELVESMLSKDSSERPTAAQVESTLRQLRPEPACTYKTEDTAPVPRQIDVEPTPATVSLRR